MNCAVQTSVRHRGKSWTTVHVCRLRRGHRGKHECRREDCRYRWARQKRKAKR